MYFEYWIRIDWQALCDVTHHCHRPASLKLETFHCQQMNVKTAFCCETLHIHHSTKWSSNISALGTRRKKHIFEWRGALSKYRMKQELLNWCVPFFGSVYVQACGGMCCVHVAYAIHHIHHLRLCVLPSRLGIQFLRRMPLYPVWIYFPTLGGEDTFVSVGVKTKFIASWLPSRMRTARMMGHREGPPSQKGRLGSKEKGRSSPCSRDNWWM